MGTRQRWIVSTGPKRIEDAILTTTLESNSTLFRFIGKKGAGLLYECDGLEGKKALENCIENQFSYFINPDYELKYKH